MKRFITQLKALGLGLCLSSAYFPTVVNADLAAETMTDFTAAPIVNADSATPMAMIAASNDHQLFLKAYNDYSDLDPSKADGIETTYKHSFDYYGYFDSYKCYNHTGSMFEPNSTTSNKYCSGNWSGNFLNWATMTRIDTVRKILFGGLRTKDDSSETILERAFLPNDAHSFAKYYNGNDIGQLTPFGGSTTTADADAKKNGLTICNATAHAGIANSVDVTDPPLLRVAKGNFSLWASNERWQCTWSNTEKNGTNANNAAASGIDAYGSSPSSATYGLGSKDYEVKVKVCVSGLLEKSCKRYPDGNYKPIGLLQTYGDDDKILFGMFAGSYSKNKSGGTLIKDVGSMTNEVDKDNGTFPLAFPSGYIAWNKAEGIINAWSMYRVVGYQYGYGSNKGYYNSYDQCAWGLNSFTNGKCRNWGNPFSEIYWNAVRYLAGEGVSGTFRANDSNVIKALNTPQTWNCPLDDTNFCASLNMIAFNASSISYDDDDLDGVSDGVQSIWSGTTSSGITKPVGDGEGITGNTYFVGENGVDNNQLCTEKVVSNLGDVKGLCPEAPRLGGTYRLAGIAHKAHIADIRSSGPQELEGDQIIDTYAVTLASSLPQITVPVPDTSGREVKILPACRNDSVSGNCAIVDFKIVEPHTVVGSVGKGKFYVNWEDSEQGGDFDQDMWGVLSYEITSTTIKVTTDTIADSTPNKMGFGYVVSGTTQDGFHTHSGIRGFTRADVGVTDCSNCVIGNAATSHTYSLAGVGASAGLLKDPLYYAAKWGAFTDENGNNIPDLQSEWDRKDAEGKQNPDGIPDTYFYATNPAELEKSLANVFNAIIAKTASGTAASVVASSRQGQGAVYQALYVTERTYDSKTVNWVGTLHSLWIDKKGLIREDSNGNKMLDDYQTDHVVKIYNDPGTRQARVCRYDSSDAETYAAIILNPGADCEANSLPLEDLATLWSASDQLSSLSSATITTQRTYTGNAANGRHILTWVDKDIDGVVDSNEFVSFTPGGVGTSSNYGYLNTTSQADADDIINYIRGEESASMRNRTIDFDGDGTEEVMLLGDIVNSTPTSVSVPAEAFDQLYGDSSYADFRLKYANRRQVIYVGANDGMLHAFNAGFFDPATIEFKTSNSGETAHPLGSELWSYVPGNLLPHLKWLTDPGYSHVYYMDAKPRVFDAKIFTSDATHPNGWGTVLVSGMRFGGGTMTVDTDQNGLGGGNAADDHKFRSSYVMFDITNPEQAPTLMAEITHPALGFTTSYPTAFAVRDKDNSVNKWYLSFGTGPTNMNTGASDQDGRLLVYDLEAKAWASSFGPTDGTNIVGSNSFVGDPIAADWDLTYKADKLYVGSAGGTAAAPTGNFFRLNINESDNPGTWTFENRLTTGKPVLARPTLSVDDYLQRWVYVGSGRFLVNDDKTSDAQQTLYGFRDNPGAGDTTSLPLTNNLVDVTDAKVSTTAPYNVTGVAGVTKFTELEGLFDATGGSWKDGWKIDLAATAGEPANRIVKEGAMLGGAFLQPNFTPSENLCGGSGKSSLFGLYYRTGTAIGEFAIFGSYTTQGLSTATKSNNNDGTGNATDDSIRELDLGDGLASTPSLHLGGELTAIIQKSDGSIVTGGAETSKPVKTGETSWREQYE